MDQKVINRINELYKKSKTSPLTPEEKQEQQILRQQYIKAFKCNLQSTLDSIVVVDKDGNKKNLKSNN